MKNMAVIRHNKKLFQDGNEGRSLTHLPQIIHKYERTIYSGEEKTTTKTGKN